MNGKTVSDSVSDMKEQLEKSEHIGGFILAILINVCEDGLDIEQDSENELVEEYIILLKEALKSDNPYFILMVNYEINLCCFGINERKLLNKIYENYLDSGMIYPVSAIGLHIDILKAFFEIGEDETGRRYFERLKYINTNVFGKKDYFFCRNLSYVIFYFLQEYDTDAAIYEYEKYINDFVQVLRHDIILYQMQLGNAVILVNRDNDPEHLGRVLEECQRRIDKNDFPMSAKFSELLCRMRGIYYRCIGELDQAIANFQYVIERTDDFSSKLFCINQIGMLMYHKQNEKGLWTVICQGMETARKYGKWDENVVELLNLKGLYYFLKGQFADAADWFTKAKRNSESLFGENVDLTMKYQSNFLLARFYEGYIEEARENSLKLLEKMSSFPEKYPEALSYVQNNLIVTSTENRIDSQYCKSIKKALDSKKTQYDLVSTVLLKSNLYFSYVMSDEDANNKEIDILEKELDKYFQNFPDGDSYIVYMKARAKRFFSLNKIKEGYYIAECLNDYLKTASPESVSNLFNINNYVLYIRILIHKRQFVETRQALLGMKEKYIIPLLKRMENKTENNAETIGQYLQLYMSIFVSTVMEYPEVGVSAEELYLFVLNYKYLAGLFYFDRKKFKEEVAEWYSDINEVSINGNSLVLEYFDYIRYDMVSNLTVIGLHYADLSTDLSQLCFVVYRKNENENRNVVEILYNRLYQEIWDDYEDGTCQTISKYEIEMCRLLRPKLYEKDKIYICTDSILPLIPLGAIKINSCTYIGELFETIYCSSALDIKEDIEIFDLNDCLFVGVSEFGELNKNENKRLHRYMNSLPFAQIEVENIAKMTGGKCIEGTIELKRKLPSVNNAVIHLATHTMMNEITGERNVIIGHDWENESNILKASDIEKMNWNNVKLAVLSGCETGGEIGAGSLRWALKKSGVKASITTYYEVEDDKNMFFMFCLYKYIAKCKKIGSALLMAQKEMKNITKREIVHQWHFEGFDVADYFQNFGDNDKPFANKDDWAVYIYQMN